MLPIVIRIVAGIAFGVGGWLWRRKHDLETEKIKEDLGRIIDLSDEDIDRAFSEKD